MGKQLIIFQENKYLYLPFKKFLMRTLTAFCLVAVLALASTYTPDWSDCSTGSPAFTTTDVTFTKPIARNEKDEINVCGSVNDVEEVGNVLLQVFLGTVKVLRLLSLLVTNKYSLVITIAT